MELYALFFNYQLWVIYKEFFLISQLKMEFNYDITIKLLFFWDFNWVGV
jgi:hypothetical protein